MEPTVLRAGIIEALHLAASAESQRSYARDVPIADVPAEVFCCWEDHYFPDSVAFERAFDADEREALAAYAATCGEIALRVPEHVDVLAFQALPEWVTLAAAAGRALAILHAASDDVV